MAKDGYSGKGWWISSGSIMSAILSAFTKGISAVSGVKVKLWLVPFPFHLSGTYWESTVYGRALSTYTPNYRVDNLLVLALMVGILGPFLF